MPRRCIPVFLFLCLFLSSLSAIAQDKTARQIIDPDANAQSEHHEQAQRQQWFRDGRTAPDPSVPAAELLHRAQQQRQQLRNLRARQSSASAVRTAAALTTTPAWQLLGPGPMVSSDDPTNFQDYGNVSGRVTAVAFDQSDPTGNTVYIAGAYGGVWKSTNAAGPAASVTWTALTDDQPTLSIGAIAVSPDGTVLLAGTGEPDNAGDSYYGLGILRSGNAKTATPTFSQITSSVEGVNFKGVGFAHFAWNTITTSNVVASVANTSVNLGSIATGNTNVGLYFSTDSGATWHQATVTDGASPVTVSSITGLTFNAAANGGAGAYFASVRTHGVFTSIDSGRTWTRLPNQPTPITTAVCPATGGTLAACPLYRGELAATPGRNEMFFWFVDVNEANQSVWVTRDGGTTWADLGTGGQMTTCGDAIGGSAAGCGTDQGSYNLVLSAIPNGTGTDLYAGAINVFKCSLPQNGTSCSAVGGPTWLNTTHVYGCSPLSALAHVHPDQHAIDFLRSTPDKVVFGNDGGVYRSLTASTGIVTGACTGTNAYDNVNTNLALTQFVHFSQDPTADQILLGGTQDNGSPSLNPTVASVANPLLWTSYLGGDGGFTAINPSNVSEWLFSEPNTQIFRTTIGVNSRGIVTNSTQIVTPTKLGGDDGAFYTPYILDSGAPGKLLIGTCRVWRGNSDGTGLTNISPNFSTGDATVCASASHTTIRSLATGGLSTASGSSVIYAGTSSSNTAKGSIFVTENANATTPTWTNRIGAINPSGYEVSSITVDDADISGRTAFITLMGFGGGHVFRTTDAGGTWTNITGDLPDAPADSFSIDPADPTVWYVATDTGVYATANGGLNWVEYSPATGPGTLPNVALTHLQTMNTATAHKLRVSTYGRGIWQAELVSGGVPIPNFAIAPSGAASQTVAKGSAASYTIGVTSGNSFTAPVTFACSAGLPTGASCTFTPASVAPGGSTTLKIQTAAASSANPTQVASRRYLALWSWAVLLPGVVMISTSGRRQSRALLMLLTVVLLVMPGCGGGGSSTVSTPPPIINPGTPPGTSTVFVSATSGVLTHTTAITLTVQ